MSISPPPSNHLWHECTLNELRCRGDSVTGSLVRLPRVFTNPPAHRPRRLSSAWRPFALIRRQTNATSLFSPLLAACEFFSTCLVWTVFFRVRLLNVVLRVVSIWAALLSQALWWWFAKSRLGPAPPPHSHHHPGLLQVPRSNQIGIFPQSADVGETPFFVISSLKQPSVPELT